MTPVSHSASACPPGAGHAPGSGPGTGPAAGPGTRDRRGRARRARGVVAALTVAGLLLSACGLNVDNSGNRAEAQETTFDAALAAFTTSTPPDPRSLRGVSTADSVGDVTPVTDSPSPSLPVSLTDADGYDVTVNDVSRILPLDLYGTTSRTVAGLGLRDNIVGRTVSSEEPSLKDLPVVTQGGHNINVEAVLNLHPSLVIVDHSIGPREAIDQIRDAGVTVAVINPKHTMDAIGDDIRTIAGVVGLPDVGESLATRAGDELSRASDTVKKIVPADPLRMAFVYARGTGGVFFILGPDSGTTDLFESVGGHDAAADRKIGDMTPATAEALAQLNPEVIVMMSQGLESTGGLDGLLKRPGIAETTAGKTPRIVAIPDSQALSFGPQAGEMVLAFAKALYQG
ncbi:ABC transporter substrate-binding protein [Corynebacterium bovis]|uniref:heme/hemin ABC transporter substrate-binding protein n=1 Tax=Corynebacterium bovis TaxID=36808 RepID=UPI003138C0EF